jgi:hypothetical protein
MISNFRLGAQVPITDLQHHLKSECKERHVYCRYGCQKVLLAKV